MKLKAQTLLILTILVSFSFSLVGQNTGPGSVKGQILNGLDNSNFQQVNIALYNIPDSALIGGTASNQDGRFEISNLPLGQFRLLAKFVGFTDYTATVILTSQSPAVDLGIITLREAVQELGGVEIVTAKPEIIYQADKKIMNVAQFKAAGATNLVEVLENAPGITTDTEGNVMLRGSSSYRLLIDGKPAQAGGTNLLRQIPADMVENIEIITNPSAKYDAEGAAGIINLVLKKQKAAGFNGALTLMAGWNNKYTGDAQFNYRKNKINLFGGVSGVSYQTAADGYLNRTLDGDSETIQRNTNLMQDVLAQSLNGNAGMDITFNNRNSITLSARGGKLINDADIINQLSLGVADANPSSWSVFDNHLGVNGYYYNPSFNFRHKFDQEGHQLDFDVFSGGFTGKIEQTTEEAISDQTWSTLGDYLSRNKTATDINIQDIRVKTDYVKPIKGGSKFETGAQYTLFSDHSGFTLKDFDATTEDWVDNALFSNDFSLNRNVFAGYGIWSGAIKKFTYQLGLRAEYTDQLINQETMNEQFSSNHLGLFPSGSASLTLDKGQQLMASFSRRINRPGGMNLNPFPQYVDNLTIRVGNPELLPALIQSYELSYQKQTKLGTLSAQTYYRKVNDQNTFVMILDEQDRIVFMPDNAQQSHSAGTELTGNLQLTKWFRLMASGNVYYYLLQDDRMEDVANQNISYTARLNSMFIFGQNTRFALTANYTGPTIMLQGKMYANFMLNAGLTQIMLKRTATLTLGVRDILRTGRTKMENYSDGLFVSTNILPESPVVTLTFTYNFNNFQRRVDEEQMDLNFIR